MANAICPPKADTVIYNAMAYYRLSKDDGAGQVSDSISNQPLAEYLMLLHKLTLYEQN